MAETVEVVSPEGRRLTVSEKSFRLIYEPAGFRRAADVDGADVKQGESPDVKADNTRKSRSA